MDAMTLIGWIIEIRDFKTGNGFDLSEAEVKLLADEIERLRGLVEIAYCEGVIDVSSRGVTIATAQDFWATSDCAQCVTDPAAQAELITQS